MVLYILLVSFHLSQNFLFDSQTRDFDQHYDLKRKDTIIVLLMIFEYLNPNSKISN